ncbi:MAG: DegT/DnrJ/EryC1/StrS family aminotransferase [Elusimicrobia bacterium]|nr:DegT/DnrJ/EryC1/StrS family aminotransferase [Elusimicrobiota bacterium]
MARREISVGGLRIGAREKRYLAQVIRSNRLSYGPFSQRFEAAFAKAHDCRFAFFCNSGTSALHIALAALKEEHGWADGDEVIVPAVTFVATANIVLHNRMVPVFVDVDPRTYNIDPALIEARITPKTRAIIPVHLMGLPADMDEVRAVASKHNLKLIEDSCETVFARYKGKKVGSLSDIGCFSTYVAHYIVTGVGGFATTNDPKLAVRLRSLMNHGRDSIYFQIDDDKGLKGAKLREVVAKRFSFVSLGHSFRATEFEAALGLAQLEEKDKIVKARQSVARRLSLALQGLEDVIQLPYAPNDRDHMFMLYPIVVRAQEKTGLVNFLEERGIETRDLLPLINQPVYVRLYGDLEARYPVARRLNHHGFYVGCHQYMGPKDVDYLAAQIRAYFKR